MTRKLSSDVERRLQGRAPTVCHFQAVGAHEPSPARYCPCHFIYEMGSSLLHTIKLFSVFIGGQTLRKPSSSSIIVLRYLTKSSIFWGQETEGTCERTWYGRKITISYMRSREVTMVWRQEDMAYVFYQSWHKPHTHLALGFKSDYPNEASFSAAVLPRSHSTDGHHVPETPLRALSRPAFQGWDSTSASEEVELWEVGRWPHVAGTVTFVCHRAALTNPMNWNAVNESQGDLAGPWYPKRSLWANGTEKFHLPSLLHRSFVSDTIRKPDCPDTDNGIKRSNEKIFLPLEKEYYFLISFISLPYFKVRWGRGVLYGNCERQF